MTSPAPDYAPPATCPGCGAAVNMTLASDPWTPIYACGSTPTRIVCDIAIHPTRTVDQNLVGLSPLDVANVAALGIMSVRGSGMAATWTPDPRIALGPCGHVTIDGECLSLDDPGRKP